MGSAFSSVVHHITKDSDNRYRVTSVTPHVRLGRYGEVVHLQYGKIWDGSGKEMPNPPGWVYEEMGKMSPSSLKEVGFDEAPKAPSDAPASVDGSAKWTCPECHQSMDADLEEPHRAKHMRRGPGRPPKSQ